MAKANTGNAFVGEVFTVPVTNGVGVFQALFAVPGMGMWIKVHEGIFAEDFDDPAALPNSKPQFYAFFPVAQAFKGKLIARIGVAPVFENELPPMLAVGGTTPDGTVIDWFVTKAGVSRRTKVLSDTEQKFQHEFLLNDTALREMIESGWRPEHSAQIKSWKRFHGLQ